MGQAVITENIGEGLYRVRLLYNTAPAEAELARLTAAQAKDADLLTAANKTTAKALSARDAAKGALNAIIAQWRAGLIQAGAETAPPAPPEVPGPPPSEESQSDGLFDAIAAARTASGVGAVARVASLDTAAASILDALGLAKSTSDSSTPERRATEAGYAFLASAGVGQALAFGQTTPAGALAAMPAAVVTGADYTEVGCAYAYRPEHTYSYLWCALLSAPGPVNTVAPPSPDPAETAATEAVDALEKVETPKTDDLAPEKIQTAVADYGKAVAAYKAAQRETDRIHFEHQERAERIVALGTLTAGPEVYAWACQYVDDLEPGEKVATAEVPGWYDPATQGRMTTMGVRDDPESMQADLSVSYQEQHINLVEQTGAGQLRSAETLQDGAIFVNLALEPAVLRWRPRWRYGQIMEIAESGKCLISLDSEDTARTSVDLGDNLLIDAPDRTLRDVPIAYPCPSVFAVGDEVLISFAGQDVGKPSIIGFRREPKPCMSGRTTWRHIR